MQKLSKILLADDDDIYSEEILQCLSAYHVIAVDDGQKALEALFADPSIDLCILDERMPRYNGTEILTEIRKQKPDLKIILMTGLSTDYIRNMLGAGHNFSNTAVLPKDGNIPVLLDAISDMLS